jgi:F-type H+-transporting ATPase subunit g
MQSFWQNIWKQAKNPSALAQTATQTASKAGQSGSILQQARNISRAQVIAGGVVFAECLGFFTVGEMIGRFKIIGYHGEPAGAAHH